MGVRDSVAMVAMLKTSWLLREAARDNRTNDLEGTKSALQQLGRAVIQVAVEALTPEDLNVSMECEYTTRSGDLAVWGYPLSYVTAAVQENPFVDFREVLETKIQEWLDRYMHLTDMLYIRLAGREVSIQLCKTGSYKLLFGRWHHSTSRYGYKFATSVNWEEIARTVRAWLI